MITKETLLKIAQYGSMAPSGHNTQPWRFEIGTDSITILPDFSRALPVVDPDNHALYISLGCALENMVIAGEEFYLGSVVNIIETEAGHIIRVRFKENPSVERSGLFDHILKRQVTRNLYSSIPVESTIEKKMLEDLDNESVKVRLFKTPEEISLLESLIIKGNTLQFKKIEFVKELVTWIRFSKNEAFQRGDGIWSASMGMPGVGRKIGSFIMERIVNDQSENKRLRKNIRNSSGFLLFLVKEDSETDWINLGRSFQRFGLKATKLSVSHSHVNMPCEERAVREEMSEKMGIKPWVPLLLIRFGYSKPMPYSFRRNIMEMVIREEGKTNPQ